MAKPAFSIVWARIVAHAEEDFTTKTGMHFTYAVNQRFVIPSRTNYALSQANFEAAYKIVPFDGPGTINATVRGPSYVWAILHDPRIRAGDW